MKTDNAVNGNEQESIALGEQEILAKAKEIRLARARKNAEEHAKLKATSAKIKLPDGKFSTIVIDPPWNMQKIQRDCRPNQVGFDYPTMTEEELEVFPIPAMAADNCYLFLWTTHKHLPEALRLAEKWGFKYVCMMVWHKNGGPQPFGLPQYNCEFCLLCKKGNLQFTSTKAFPTCFNGARREHSRKPDEFYDMIARVTPEPRIDVFSREKRNGFSQFGNETDKY